MYNVNKSQENKVSLKEVRTRLGLKQADLAKMLGTSRTEVNRIENGKRLPEWYEKTLRLSAVLERAGLSFDDLILALPDKEETEVNQ